MKNCIRILRKDIVFRIITKYFLFKILLGQLYLSLGIFEIITNIMFLYNY